MNNCTRHHSAGFSMIEVLVSLLITVIGVLGMVALQSKAIPYTQDSVQRNAAIMLADDLVEIIRSASTDCTADNSCLIAPGSHFPAVPLSCKPTPIALADQIGCWTARAAAALPGAASLLTSTFYICRTSAPGVVTSCTSNAANNPDLEIKVAWTVKNAADCMTGGDSATTTGTCSYTLRTRVHNQ